MQKHIVYITSDANRIYLEAGYCQDISLQLFELQQAHGRFMTTSPKFSRIVHVEEFENYEAAQKRKLELNSFTKMQKERIIRRYNPNWLSITNNMCVNKKAAVYA